jgi:hypothetical protein
MCWKIDLAGITYLVFFFKMENETPGLCIKKGERLANKACVLALI